MSKKGKKRKYIDLDQNIGEYDEEQEKKDIDKTLEFIQTTFSLTDDEMTDLLNYEFLDEDLRDFDRLASILIDRQEKQREEEEKKEKEKEKKEQVISEEVNKDISKEEGKKSKLKEYLESIDKKDDYKDDNMKSKNKKGKHKNKYLIKKDFNIEKAEEFLKSTKNKTEIDLHEKRLFESMYIVENKINSLKQKKSEECLKEITLTIITGVGYHSPGGKPVLHPNLTKWLKAKRKYKVDEKSRAGHIFVTIY